MNKQKLELKEHYLPDSYRDSDSQFIRGRERVFSLLESITSRDDASFYLIYKSNEAFSLVLNEQMYSIPAVSDLVSVKIPLEQSTAINSFTIVPSSENCSIELIEMGVGGSDPILDPSEKIVLNYSSPNTISISHSSLNSDTGLSLVVKSDRISDEFDTIIQIDVERVYEIKAREGLNQVWLYDLPVESDHNIYLDLGPHSLSSLDFDVSFQAEEAIYIDLEEFISFDPQSWRQADYEFFRWDLFPQMLLLDTISYEVQAEFFKRLAFFTEKKHSVGELLSNEELNHLHGWNAHDYRADDLSRFFNKAQQSGFILNEYEIKLKDILLSNGVLVNSGERVRPGKGGILSISRSSTERLRWLFMNHECYHGVFFSSEEFTLAVEDIWRNLAEEEREFWRVFLDLYGYNINDEYLLINEFQAYLMQQDISLADSYFRGKIHWILRLKPHLQSAFDLLLYEYGDTFSRSAEAVERAAYSLTGIRAGDLVLKRKK